MDDLASSHTVIKALKGSEDPPTPGGLSKIEIARKTWESTSIHFPNKDEMLAEWILSAFLKHNKEAWGPNGKGLVLSAPHWSLLSEILFTDLPSQNVRQNRVWLPPLLNRISILNIVTIFFKCASDTKLGRKKDLVDEFTRCVHVLWPLATVRMNLDALTECLGSILEYISSNTTQLNSLASVCLLVARSFRQAVGNTSSKKKAFSWFTQHSFLHWVHFMCIESSIPISLQRDAKVFKSEVYQAGIDIFFCIDSLKGSKDPLKTLLTDPQFSLSSIQSTQLQIVPMLYSSYVQEMRKHRLAMFGSGSNQAQEQMVQNRLRDAGVMAFSACYNTLREYGDVLEMWKSVLALVKALGEANLVGYGLSEETDVLSEIAASAVGVLAGSRDDRVERFETALQILHVLSRIDFDFVNPFLLDILSVLLTMNPSVYPSTRILLREILDFHTKTRTMPSYLALLLECLSKNSIDKEVATQYSIALTVHRECTSGALLSLAHLEDISRCIKNFVTPGQTQEAVDSTLAALRNSWSAYSDKYPARGNVMDIDVVEAPKEKITKFSEGRKRKRRKTESTEPSASESMSATERAALAYSLVARAVAVIVPSLPFSSLSESTYSHVRTSISDAWTGYMVEAAQTVFAQSELPNDCWAAQSVFAATLRIRHALMMCPALRPLDALGSPIMMTEKTIAFIRSSETIPELVVELFRAFFDADFRGANSSECDATIEALLTYLTTNLSLSDTLKACDLRTQGVWDASTSSLDLLEPGGHARGALAIWHLLLDRWLPVFDEVASPERLKVLARICLLQSEPNANSNEQSGGLSFSWVLERAMHSAAFWELPNLRDAMVSEMDTVTSHADWRDFSELLEQAQPLSKPKKGSSFSSAITWDVRQARSVSASFSMLLHAPREYLPRNSRFTFSRRALVSDLALAVFERDATENSVDVGRKVRTVVRTWLVSMSDVFGIVDVIADGLGAYADYLMHSADGPDDADDDFNAVTLELLSGAFRQVIRSAVHGKEDQLRRMCASLRGSSSNLSEQSFLQFVEILAAVYTSADKLSLSCVKAVRELYSDMHARYSSAMSAMLPSLSNISRDHALTIHSWRTCLVLRKWLNEAETMNLYGPQLTRKFMASRRDLSSSDADPKSLGTQIFVLLLQELHIVAAEEREQHLALIVSSYVLFLGRLSLADRDACDLALGRTARSMLVKEFAFALSLLREALSRGLSTNGEILTAVHLSSVLLGDAPEGAMKITQEHFEECMHIFSAEPIFVSGDADLSLEVLTLIGKVCSDKPASLRLSALGPIWLLLAKLLVGSTIHTAESHAPILHAIVSTAGSLVRLRRDLVTSTLPHLAAVLRALFRALCAPRAQLGVRQRTLVSDTLPWWVAPSAPLGAPEARAVARLLTTLQTKTVPRTFTSRDRDREKDNQRGAEALLGAFSKHAGPVLGAYVGALVDPLVVLDAAVREALAPGLYALCEAMGEHGRDALMAGGLDAGGRTVLKALWRDYEKQRYVGKG